MSGDIYQLKCKWAIASHAKTIITVAATIAIVCGLIISTGFVTPASAYSPTTLASDDDQRPPQITHSVDQAQEISATVDTTTPAYTEGERLSNVNTYPLDAVTDIQITTTAAGTETSLSQHRLLIQYEATVNGQSSPFWTKTTTVDQTEIESNTQSEPITLESTVNISKVHGQLQKFNDEFEGDASVKAYTIVKTDYSYESSESRASTSDPVITSATATHKQEIVFGNSVFTIPTSGDTTSTTTGQPGQSEDASSNLGNIVSTFMLLISTSIGGFCYSRRNHYDPETLEMRIEEIQHEEWITVLNTLDTTSTTTTSIAANLEDIIDLAIDKGDRVVYCIDRQLFVFVDDETEYIYSPPEPPLIAEEIDTSNFDIALSNNHTAHKLPNPDRTQTNNPPKENGNVQLKDNGGTESSSPPENPPTEAIDKIWIEK